MAGMEEGRTGENIEERWREGAAGQGRKGGREEQGAEEAQAQRPILMLIPVSTQAREHRASQGHPTGWAQRGKQGCDAP